MATRVREQKKFLISNVDYVYTIGTTVSKVVKGIINRDVPQIFNCVTDPVASKIVDSLDEPGKNMGGVGNITPLDMQLKNAKKLINFQRLGVFHNPREHNSNLILDRLIALEKKFQFEVTLLRVSPGNNRLQHLLSALNDGSISVDAVYLPGATYLLSQTEIIGKQLKQAKIKSIGGIERYMRYGVMMGTVSDYPELGRQAARIIDRNQKGESLDKIGIQTPPDFKLVINLTTAKELGVVIPPEILRTATIIE